MAKMIDLTNNEAKALYKQIVKYCKQLGTSPYKFGYTAGVSHNYVYRLKEARSKSYNLSAIEKIKTALLLNGPIKVNVVKPKIEIKAEGQTLADKFDALSDDHKDSVNSLVHALHERTVLQIVAKEKIDRILNTIMGLK